LAAAADNTHMAGSSSTLPVNRLEDARLAARVLRRETHALAALISRHKRPMIRLAQRYVRDQTTAAEVVHETWDAVVCAIARFQGRGSWRSWIYAILVNLARRRGKRDAHVVPFAVGGHRQGGPRDRPLASGLPGRSADAPSSPRAVDANAAASPEECVVDQELLEVVIRAIAALPVSQRAVIYLRDVRGLAPGDVCALLSLSDGAQRIRLHRARHEVRGAVAAYLAGGAGNAGPLPTNHGPDGSRPAAAR
jgi:RNA polymerase sigma-70 factor (ECF subfamily)